MFLGNKGVWPPVGFMSFYVLDLKRPMTLFVGMILHEVQRPLKFWLFCSNKVGSQQD